MPSQCISEFDLLRIVVHDNGHAVEIEAVGLGHHTLSEAVGDVVRAQESGDHACELERDKGKGDSVPRSEDLALKAEVVALAAGKSRARVAGLGDGGLDVGAKVAAAVKLVLDAETASETDAGGPLGVDLALEVEGLFLVGDISGSDEQAKGDPEEESVDGKECAIVEEDSRPADH